MTDLPAEGPVTNPPAPLPLADPAVSRRQQVLGILGVLVFTVGITGLTLYLRRNFQHLELLGYPGVFLTSLLSAATIVFPAPGLAVTFAMGSVLNPFLVALLASLGESIGEFSGYAAGRAGRAVFGNDPRYARLEDFTRRRGGWAVLFFASLPIGVFDIVGVAAGATRMPLHQFIPAMLLGKIVKNMLVAIAGAYSVTWLSNLFF